MKNNKNAKLDIAELIKEREKLINENPQLKTEQRQVDTKLSKGGRNSSQRAKLMFEHMLDQYEKELTPALDEMKSIKTVLNEIKSSKKKGGKVS